MTYINNTCDDTFGYNASAVLTPMRVQERIIIDHTTSVTEAVFASIAAADPMAAARMQSRYNQSITALAHRLEAKGFSVYISPSQSDAEEETITKTKCCCFPWFRS